MTPSNEQWVLPNLYAEDVTGACLRFVQRTFQNLNPYYYRSARIAWDLAKHKTVERNIPNDVAVPVYLSHYGTYDDGLGQYGSDPNNPYYGDWGHVVTHVPGRGFLSSPAGGYGQQWFSTIEQIEQTFGAKYLGWAFDVGGLIVAFPKKPAGGAKPPPKTPIEEITVTERNYTKAFNPNQVCEPNKWTTILVNDENWVSIMNSGALRRRGVAHVALRTTGAFEARFLYSTVNPEAKNKVVRESGSVVQQHDRNGLHTWPFELAPKTKTEDTRIRIQIRPIGDKSVKVTSVRAIVDYDQLKG